MSGRAAGQAAKHEENEMTRTWTASIQVWDGRRTTTMPATDSQLDLLRDQTLIAVREASALVDDASEVRVTLWKQTKARGIEPDRHFVVYRDKHGVVRYQ